MHYVYYLLSPVTAAILYIGRSNNPAQRKWSFERDHKMSTEFGISQRYRDFTEACRAELKAIYKHDPPFNHRLVSSRGRLGQTHITSPETKAKISATWTPERRDAQSVRTKAMHEMDVLSHEGGHHL